MTRPHPDSQDEATRPISVAELLAKNGTIGSPPVSGRRRRRRGNSDAVTVAELTGEIPVIRDVNYEPEPPSAGPAEPPSAGPAEEDRPVTAPRPVEHHLGSIGWAEAGSRWPKSSPHAIRESQRRSGLERSPDPRPARRSESAGNGQSRRPASKSGAEQMRPDPVDNYVDLEVDVLDTDVRDADLPSEDSAYVRSYLRNPASDTDAADGLLDLPSGALDEDHTDIEGDLAGEFSEQHGRWSGLVGGVAVVAQSVLAVAFGGGLFIAFDQLWRWNSIVALVLTVLVTLGLVAAVQAVRKTVDVASTLIAVAVGLLVTLGPLALNVD